MTERINTLLQWIVEGEHKALRMPLDAQTLEGIRAQIQREDLPLVKRAALRLRLLLENERVCVREDERIPGIRTIPEFPDIYADGEKERIFAGHFMHEQGRVCNISSDFEGVLREGLLARRARAEKTMAEGRGDLDFLEAAIETIDAVIAFADRYADAMPDGAGLKDAMRYGAKDFLNALRMFRMLHLSLWASNVYHNTVGRFDQYMWPYLKADLDKGMTNEEALELLEEFFLTFNRDSDLYTGMQQGDNGQSLMLGGCDKDGNDASNVLTGLCLTASLEMRRIDPKINLRVNKDTPLEVYEYCTKLTKQGLGFPQYANDDVVIPGLVKLGYDLEDARNYTVAACWEFIVPGVAIDIPNIGAMPLAEVVREACENGLAGAKDFADFQGRVVEVLNRKAKEITDGVKNIFIEPAPWQSVLMTDCLTTGHDISEGAKYNNYGIHGSGLANAVDALEMCIRDRIDPGDLVEQVALAEHIVQNQAQPRRSAEVTVQKEHAVIAQKGMAALNGAAHHRVIGFRLHCVAESGQHHRALPRLPVRRAHARAHDEALASEKGRVHVNQLDFFGIFARKLV